MAEKLLRALTIKSKSNPPGKSEYKWDVIPEIENFTRNIIIPELGIDKDGTAKVDIGAIVSGMPTVFARANLFRNALDNVTDKEADVSGLMLFYKSLIDEWRGFLSLIALNYKDVTVERVFLQYSDGKGIFETSNVYEPIGAFGNMLFERKPLWCDQTLSQNQERIPFIDVVSFKGEVIGATSPDSFLFTSVGYKLSEKLPFVNINNGKLLDPLKSDLLPEQLYVLHSFVQNVVNKIDNFKSSFNAVPDYLRPNYSSIYGNLQDWLKEIDAYAEDINRGWIRPSSKPATPPEVSAFHAPFSILFNHSTELYGLNGVIFSEKGKDGAIEFNPKELLLPDSTEVVMFRFSTAAEKDPEFLASRPLLLLRADVKDAPNQYAYFSLPLTPHALNVFGNNLAALTGIQRESEVKSRLTAEYEVDKMGERLSVKLRLHTHAGIESEINIKYNVGGEIAGRDILMWPNFISKKWNRYFLFNEIPHNDIKYQATPFIGDVNDDFFRIVVNENKEPLYLAKDGKISDLPENYKASLLIENNQKVIDNPYKYEIYESKQPFKGVKFAFKDKLCGYAIIRYDKNGIFAGLPRDLTSEEGYLENALLGIDFGSTNTSIAYYSEKENAVKEKIVLKNRRVSLLSSDDKNNDEQPAVEDEIYFFQNDEVTTNAIKSILSLHDYKRISNPTGLKQEQILEKEVYGGFPCFEKNMPIENSEGNRIILNFNRSGVAELKFNMKWSSNAIDKSYKKAYLSSLMLHVYAQLFEEGHLPVSIKWSYPSSMSKNLLTEYWEIYNSLKHISPVVDPRELKICMPSDLSENDFGGENTWNSSGIGGASWNDQVNPGSSGDWSNSNSENNAGWGSSSQGWSQGNENASSGGWGDSQSGSSNSKSMSDVKIDNGPLNFNFQALGQEESLTEACAVANYFLETYTGKPNELLMIFDVGGSTTDICVLSQMNDSQGAPGKAMIKQNSIRWAAQRMAQATRYSKNFQSVLLRMCERKKIKISGLNSGPLKYNENTAPYYFEQLVDRLDDQDFPDFYRLIAAECKELMSVNLYITGLIMYYAGQLAFKLRQEMLRSDNVPAIVKNRPPQINIAFAGKGSRIFDWFEAINPKASKDYYTQMFIRGIGGMEVAKTTITPIGNPDPIININAFRKQNNPDVKYEVSKGLAIPTYKSKILVPTDKQAIEILGEEGFCVYLQSGEAKYLDFSNSVTSEMMEQLGTYFVSSPEPGKAPCPRFMDFADLFYKASSSLFGFNMRSDDFIAGFNSMNIESFIKQDPDYIEAQKKATEKKKFNYVVPIFVMEGIKFYEERILKALRA
jgi:hypothetical protein